MNGMSRQTGRAINDDAPELHHLYQSVQDLLGTLIGTRLCRRDYGSLVPHLIDQPCNEATQIKLFSSVATAIYKFEPRLAISQIKIIQAEQAHWTIEVQGTTNIYNQQQAYVERFKLGAVA